MPAPHPAPCLDGSSPFGPGCGNVFISCRPTNFSLRTAFYHSCGLYQLTDHMKPQTVCCLSTIGKICSSIRRLKGICAILIIGLWGLTFHWDASSGDWDDHDMWQHMAFGKGRSTWHISSLHQITHHLKDWCEYLLVTDKATTIHTHMCKIKRWIEKAQMTPMERKHTKQKRERK